MRKVQKQRRLPVEPLAQEALFYQYCDQNNPSEVLGCFKQLLIEPRISKTKITKAVTKLKQIANKQKNIELFICLADLYKKGVSNLIDANKSLAKKFEKKASELGHVPSTLNLALSTKNVSEKLRLLSQAIEQSQVQNGTETYITALNSLEELAKQDDPINPAAMCLWFKVLAQKE